MDRDLSSDEEDDHQTLIHQNEIHNPQKISSFHINNEYPSPKFHFNFQKRYYKWFLLAIFIPLFIIILYFTTHFPNAFSSNVIASNNSNNKLKDDPIRESELRALYLLKEQQLGLSRLWNRTLVMSGMSSNSSSVFEDVKSAVIKQISLNKEIERVLLYPHRLESAGDSNNNNLSDTSLSDFDGYVRCGKVNQMLGGRRTIEWKPREDKYLFAICLSGQMSNHLICLEKHMFFAALLGRVLVVPSSKVDYQYNRVLDIDHVNKCSGRKVVVAFEEFSEKKKSHLHIDRLICYFSLPTPCYVDEEHIKKLKSLGISMGKIEPAWVEDIKKPKKRTVQDVEAKFSSDEDVIAIGDVFFADVEKEWVMQPGGPLAHKCKTLIEPSRLIMLTAQRFIQTFLGKNFIALHFRRHGFLKFCNAKEPSCFFPIPQAAECINRVVERTDSPVIYLSTDAAESETSLLQSLIVVNGKVVPLVKRPARNSAEKWDALLYRHGLQEDSQVDAMLDKTICAMSSVFIGSSGSTFTDDILRLRKDWGSASRCDEYLCHGELPDFIADDE